MTAEEKKEYNRQRREQYRKTHPVTTDKQRRIIAARVITVEERAKRQAERDMMGEIERQQAEEVLRDLWTRYVPGERNKAEAHDVYERRMLIAQYRERIDELTAEREKLMRTGPLTSEVISKANQIAQLKYNYARKIAELMEDAQKGKLYILREYGIRLD